MSFSLFNDDLLLTLSKNNKSWKHKKKEYRKRKELWKRNYTFQNKALPRLLLKSTKDFEAKKLTKHFWSKISFAYWRFLVIYRSPSFFSLPLGHFEVKISQIYPCFSYYFHNLDLFFKVLNLTCAKLYTIFPSFNAARFWSLSKKKEKLKKKLLKKRLKNARKYKNEIINFQSNSCQISL